MRWINARGFDVFMVIAAVLVVTAPVLFTSSGFAVDFTNDLWVGWVAGREFIQGWHPSYFFNTDQMGAFYPFFAFYGGTLYTVTGTVSALLGDRPLVGFAVVTALAVAGCYMGMLWLGRQLGLRGWTAHAPALTVVTSAYYITNLYGRGDWREFVATSTIAPLLAASVHLARAPTWRPLPVLVFVLAMIIFTGSHSLTLIWGTTMVAIALLVMWLALGAPRRLPYPRLARIAGLGAIAALVNAWFLFPDIAYFKNTMISTELAFDWYASSFFNTPSLVLDPFRRVPFQSSTPALFVQAPVWFLAWGLVAGVLLQWRRPITNRLRGAWLGAAIMVGLTLGLIFYPPVWKLFTYPWTGIQVPYRIGTYVFYAIAGLVLISALQLQRASAAGLRYTSGLLRFALVAVCAVSLGLCIWQQWVPKTLITNQYFNSDPNRSEALTGVHILPTTWYDRNAFLDLQAPVVTVPGERLLLINPRLVHDNHYSAWMNVPPGREPIQTNIGGGSYIAHISGLERVGRSAKGYAVVRRLNNGSGPVHVTVEVTHSPVVELSWALSILAVIALFVILTYLSVGVRLSARGPTA